MSAIKCNQMYSGKKLCQTKINFYFTGSNRIVPMDVKMPNNKKTSTKIRKKLSFPAAPSTSKQAENYVVHAPSDIISSIPKRKLPAPILSEDEDSGNEFCTPSPPKRAVGGTQNKSKTLNKLSKPNSSDSPIKSKVCVTKNGEVSSPNKSSPEKLQTTITPKKSPRKNVKDEEKKVNYLQLKVIQELIVNVFNNDHFYNLFSTDEKKILQTFSEMDKDYKYVCVKLFMRKRTWYNIFKFVENIGLMIDNSKVATLYDILKLNHFVVTDYMKEDLFTLLNLLSLKDIREIARIYKFTNVALSKDILIRKLQGISKTQISLCATNMEEVLKQKIQERLGFCVKLSSSFERCIYAVYVLNTFTNPDLLDPQDYFKDVSFMNAVFPPHEIEKFSVFYTPLEFSRFLDAQQLRSDLRKAVEKRNSLEIFEICKIAYDRLQEVNASQGNCVDNSRPPHLERFTANSQFAYILSSGARQIKAKYFENALIWYEYLLSQSFCKHKRGEWYDNLVLIYSQYSKKYEKAARLLVKAFKEDKNYFSEVQCQELAHRGRMLNKKNCHIPVLLHDEIAVLSLQSCDRDWPQDVLNGLSMPCDEPGRRRVYVHRDKNGDVNFLTVEQTALEYYKTVGYPNGEHCEGGLIKASFCILFWDIIYEKYVKGTFISKLQSMPLDMYTDYFYKNREKEIKRRLSDIMQNWSDEDLKQKIFDTWTQHSHETALCTLESTVKDPRYLYDIISCIGRGVLAKIFQRLVKNYKLYRSGFPDLIVWNTQEQKAKFVEVKSEKDKLSFKQKLWLNYLMDIGAAVAVCHVEPKASKKRLGKKKPAVS